MPLLHDDHQAPRLDLTVSVEGDDHVVAIDGDVDSATCDRLRTVTRGLLAMGVTTVILDCDRLSFMDSSGIAVIAEALIHVREHEGTLILRRAPAVTRRLFEVVGLADQLTFD